MLKLECDECKGRLFDDEQVYCAKCYADIEKEKEELEKEVNRLKDYIDTLEEDIQDLKEAAKTEDN